MNIKENELMTYACDKFEDEKYDEALEAFILLYSKNYERDWIWENIYQCYVKGNEAEFQKAYNICKKSIPISYEQCALDFVPYREGEYYIYDKEMQEFRGVFSINSLNEEQPDELLKQIEFDTVALVIDWDWRDHFRILVSANKRKLHVVCNDMSRCASFFKIPELVEYMKNVYLFSNFKLMQSYFHENTEQYLPRIWYGSQADQEQFSRLVEEEHQYRLTPQGRNTENVLLTIGIPTYHRGQLLLQRLENLIKIPYDAEIEFVVSKNGTGVYQEEYDHASRMEDARLNYFDHGKDLKPEINWHYVVEMANGQYVLFVSDEDDVVIGALNHYLELISEHSDISLIRAKSEFQGCVITKREYGEKGIEAFEHSFLRQNYLSGIMVRRKDFMECDLLKLEKYSDNDFYKNYPHEWWCAFLNKKGAYLQEPVTLISEQDYLAEEEAGHKGENFLPVYATYEARLKQLKGEIEFLSIFMGDDQDFLELGMALVMGKMDYLFGIARYRKYDLEHYEERICEYGKMCMEAIDKFHLNNERKKHLLEYLKKCCLDLLNEHMELCLQEAK